MVLSFIIIAYVAAADCFQANILHFAYSLPDYSGNYTSVKEYWVSKGSSCTASYKSNNKITFYSSNIAIKYLMSYKRGKSCGPNSLPETYKSGKPVDIGDFYNKTCKVTYTISNNNTLHDQRIQVFQKGGSASAYKLTGILTALVASLFTQMWFII